MEETRLKELLRRVAEGSVSVPEALERLKVFPFEDMGFARVDHHRSIRRGFPEVILCERKAPEQIAAIARGIMEQGGNVLATRCSSELFAGIAPLLPEARYHDEGALFAVEQRPLERSGTVAVVSGGTSDRPVSEEAALTAHYLGCHIERLYDVGVAGIHRLLSSWELIREADVLVVVAGMEGALASVVAGIADSPVIAVPTSVGYGASFGGIAALLAMLNSCAGGVTVVNIDNGFGAGFAASLICRRIYAPREERRSGRSAGRSSGRTSGPPGASSKKPPKRRRRSERKSDTR
jgi:NCAIR mutase (PurE)-related protein